MAITLFYERDNLTSQGAATWWRLARLSGWAGSGIGSGTNVRVR